MFNLKLIKKFASVWRETVAGPGCTNLRAWCGLAVVFRNKWMAANNGLKPRSGGEREGQRVLMHLLLEILPVNLWSSNKIIFLQILS